MECSTCTVNESGRRCAPSVRKGINDQVKDYRQLVTVLVMDQSWVTAADKDGISRDSVISFLDSSTSSDLSSLSAPTSLLFSTLSESYDSFTESHETEEIDELGRPLYNGAEMTALQSCILMLQFKYRFSLSKRAFAELIDLIALHLPNTINPSYSKAH